MELQSVKQSLSDCMLSIEQKESSLKAAREEAWAVISEALALTGEVRSEDGGVIFSVADFELLKGGAVTSVALSDGVVVVRYMDEELNEPSELAQSELSDDCVFDVLRFLFCHLD